jgi:hypothetical protein
LSYIAINCLEIISSWTLFFYYSASRIIKDLANTVEVDQDWSRFFREDRHIFTRKKVSCLGQLSTPLYRQIFKSGSCFIVERDGYGVLLENIYTLFFQVLHVVKIKKMIHENILSEFVRNDKTMIRSLF